MIIAIKCPECNSDMEVEVVEREVEAQGRKWKVRKKVLVCPNCQSMHNTIPKIKDIR